MPFPSTGTERPRPDIAETLFEFDYAMNINNFIALDIFPLREVGEFKGDFGRVTLKNMLKRSTLTTAKPPGYAFVRAMRSAYPTEDTEFTMDSYETEEFGLEGIVDERESASYRSYFEQEAFTAQFVNHQLLTEMEVRVADKVFDTVEFTVGNGRSTDVGATATRQWNDYDSADPVKQVRDAKFAIYNKSGVWPDSIVFNQFAWEHLIETDDIRSRVHSQGAGTPDRAQLITEQIVSQILGLNVMVAGGTKDANNPNQAAAAPTQIWGPHAMVFKRANSRNLREIALGRTFHWPIDRSMATGFVESYYKPEVRADKIRVRHQLQNKRVYSDVGHLLQDVYA